VRRKMINEELTFPIEGELRETMLSIEVVIMFFCFEFFILFFSRYLKRSKKSNALSKTRGFKIQNIPEQFNQYLNQMKNREFAWGLLFFLLGIMFILFIIGDYYTNLADRKLIIDFGYICFFLGATIFSISIERNELKRLNLAYSKFFIFIFILLVVTILMQSELSKVVSGISLVSFSLFGLLYMNNLVENVEGSRKYSLPIYSLLIGVISFVTGFSFSTDFMVEQFGLVIRLSGDLISLFGLIMCALSFFNLPNFSEFDYLDKIRAIYVINPSGISLFSHFFREDEQEEKIESDLTTGAIIAINSILQDMASKEGKSDGKKLESIQKNDFTMLLEYGKHVICVLLADEDSKTLRDKIQIFCDVFELRYKKQLKNWFGKTDHFNSATDIVEKVFKNF
jgi:hypothetical protein